MTPPPPTTVTYREALWVWCRIAALSFGGPTAQISVMHRLLVEEKKWVSEQRFLHALNYCMLLPGPEAQQLATYIGWLLHGTRGGLTAGTLFILPGFVTILLLSMLYVLAQGNASPLLTTVVAAVFFGIKPAVTAVVVEAVLRIGKKVLKNGAMVIIAVLAFVAIFFFELPFPLIILAAGITGLIGGRLRPEWFEVIQGHGSKQAAALPAADAAAGNIRVSPWRSLQVLTIWLTLWFLPLLALRWYFGAESVFYTEGIFFSQAAVVTFGGAYSVLSYIGQKAVGEYGWLKPTEMLDGLGMAESTPGPLIMVVQFVGFMGAYRDPGELPPLAAGILGSLITVWVTFVPCFLWIFLGAPYIERLRNNRRLNSALSAITAAVVGVVLNLAIWFGLHVLFGTVTEVRAGTTPTTASATASQELPQTSAGISIWQPHVRWFQPQWNTIRWGCVFLFGVALLLIFVLKRGMFTTLGICIAAGALLYSLGFR